LQDHASAEPWIEPRAARRTSFVPGKWKVTGLAAIAALILLGFFFWQGGTVTPVSAADVALDRMIEAASQPVVRAYRIRVTDPGPEGAAPPIFSGAGGRKPGIDGAELFVEGSDKFVLIRHFGNGTDFITGSDGKLGWAVAPQGHVHLSKDTRRFRRAVPGEHEEIPFSDLKSGFSELRRAYRLTLVAADDSEPERHGWSRLDAVRRSPGRNGPEQVRIWFDAAGVAHRIELVGMPQEHGGPVGVALELIEQRDAGPDFFEHTSHHDANRPVDWE
jgi:hypothetical protein